MSLLFTIFDQLAGTNRDAFFDNASKKLPLSQTLTAMLSQSSLGGFQMTELQFVYRFVKQVRDTAKLHRNPEFFAAIQAILSETRQQSKCDPMIMLKLQAGILKLADIDQPDDGFYRLLHSEGEIYQVHRCEIRPLPNSVTGQIGDSTVRVFLPLDGLFDDLVGSERYGKCNQPVDKMQLTGQIADAAACLIGYDADLWQDFQKAISWVVLTPDFGDPKLWSYSGRLGYYGALFINPYQCPLPGIVESLIHEYYHQRLWLWWERADIDGLPAEAEIIVSPMTGWRRSVPVMLHALLIYVESMNFHDWLIHHGAAQRSDRDWSRKRRAALGHCVPDLVRLLADRLPSGSAAARMVEAAADQAAAADSAYT